MRDLKEGRYGDVRHSDAQPKLHDRKTSDKVSPINSISISWKSPSCKKRDCEGPSQNGKRQSAMNVIDGAGGCQSAHSSDTAIERHVDSATHLSAKSDLNHR